VSKKNRRVKKPMPKVEAPVKALEAEGKPVETSESFENGFEKIEPSQCDLEDWIDLGDKIELLAELMPNEGDA